MEEHDLLMEYSNLQFGREDADCRYGDKMYIVRLREKPVFVGYFCGRVIVNSGVYYVVQAKNTCGALELYLPGVVKSERELSAEEKMVSKSQL